MPFSGADDDWCSGAVTDGKCADIKIGADIQRGGTQGTFGADGQVINRRRARNHLAKVACQP
jgi:hypothetical protein